MTESHAPSISLSEEQLAVVKSDVHERQLVTAPAGTGKTHVLVARVCELIANHDISPGDEIIVLSFSRAAVEELQRRATLQEDDSQFVAASTFDSFATFLLATGRKDSAWECLDYTGRVRAATELLRDPGSDLPQLDVCRHILIDEIQDLVGVRVEFVTELLKRVDCGFTLFGDMAQAIYGYQSEGVGPQQLLDRLDTSFGSELEHRTLSQDHRAKGDLARSVQPFGHLLRDRTTDQIVLAEALRTFLLQLPTVGNLQTARRMFLRDPTRTTAVLCRTNGEVLLTSQRLHELGVANRLQRSADDRAAVPWIANCFADLEITTVSRSLVCERLDTRCAAEGGASELWPVLRRLDPSRGDRLDLRHIADRIRSGGLPERLVAQVDSPVIVSTVHRAKGLEFDRVILGEWTGVEDADLEEANRILYVALSRSRDEIFVMDRPDVTGLFRDPSSRRWVRRGFGPNRWRTYAIEMVGSDVHASDPAGAWLVEGDVVDTQHHVREHVMPGDQVELRRVPAGDDELAFYGIFHWERVVGVTSESFATTLRKALGRRIGMPERIDGLRVELVDTATGHESVGRAAGLGATGMWLRVRIAGLGDLTFTRPDIGDGGG